MVVANMAMVWGRLGARVICPYCGIDLGHESATGRSRLGAPGKRNPISHFFQLQVSRDGVPEYENAMLRHESTPMGAAYKCEVASYPSIICTETAPALLWLKAAIAACRSEGATAAGVK